MFLNSIGSADKRCKKSFKIKIKSHIETLEIELFSWSTIHVLKEMIMGKTGIKLKDQRLFFSDNQELLRNNQNMFDYNIDKDTILYLTNGVLLDKKEISYIKPHEGFVDLLSPEFEKILIEIKKGWASNINPVLTENGTSGTYLLKSLSKANLAIFKPFDEEPYADNNPKGYTGKLGSPGFRSGIRSGESAAREVATYLLDLKGGFHGVPETVYAEVKHHYFNRKAAKKGQNTVKFGSLQVFKKHHDIVGNYGPILFSAKDVRKIAILDIRILNCDRNEENILVRKVAVANVAKRDSPNKGKNYELEMIPIDHGLSFPDKISICSYEIVWMEWPQIQQPFTREELDFINAIDPEEDVKFLQKHLKFREICLRNFRLAEILLKRCANNGFTLYQIGTILYKEDPDELSQIERIIQQAEYMFSFTKRSVEQTLFVSNLIKKTKFMTHNNNFIPGLRKFFCKKSFLDDKRIAKDDNALAYGEKDPFKTSRFKKKIQRNLSHRGNLSELESNKEYKDNNVSKDLNINDLKDINHIKNFNILKGTIPNDIDRKEFNQKKGTNKNINVKDSKPLKDLTSNDKEDLIDFKDPKDLIELNGLKNLKDLKDFKNLHSTDYKTLKDPRHLLFPLTQKTIIEEKEENEISSSDDGLNINEEDKEELESSNSDENFSWDRIKQQKPELKPLKKNTSEQKNGEIEKKEELRKKKLVKVISMPELNGVVDKIEKIERNGVEKQYDEIFFYYFESYLDQFLVKKLNRKRLSSHG